MLKSNHQANQGTERNGTPRIPTGWAVHRLGDLCRVAHGYAFARQEMVASADKSLPVVVTIGNFRYAGCFRFRSTTTKRITGLIPQRATSSPGAPLRIMTSQTPNGADVGIPSEV